MSKYMLCDDATINDINPYVSRDFSLPGGVRQIPDFADHSEDLVATRRREAPVLVVDEPLSVTCDIASTAGDRTVDFCSGGREPPCPLARDVHPKRNIDYGWTKTNLKFKDRAAAPPPTPSSRDSNLFIFIILLTILVGSFLRR